MAQNDFWLASPQDSPRSDWTIASPVRPTLAEQAEFDFAIDSPIINVETTFQVPSISPFVPEQIIMPPSLLMEQNVFPSVGGGHKRIQSSGQRIPTGFFSLPSMKPTMPETRFPMPELIVKPRRIDSAPLPIVDMEYRFKAMCEDPVIRFNPFKLGFIPSKVWSDQEMSFGDLVTSFFQKKSNSNMRFSHKLYNALKMSEADHFYSEFLGIGWVNQRVFKVEKKAFARLLGIKTIDGSFFHQQGNFPSHGFVELTPSNAANYVGEKDLENVDFDNVRLFIHEAGIFVRNCTESVLEACRWISIRRK